MVGRLPAKMQRLFYNIPLWPYGLRLTIAKIGAFSAKQKDPAGSFLLFDCSHEASEHFRMIFGEIGQYFAIEGDIAFLE